MPILAAESHQCECSCTFSLFITLLQFNTYFESTNFWFKSFHFSNILFTHQPKPTGFWSSIQRYFCPLNCIWFADWALPIKNSGYVYARFQEIFLFGYFPFQPIKNNAVLEPRTGHFRGLVEFEAKAKDLSFVAKDFKMCPRGLHFCQKKLSKKILVKPGIFN